MAENKDSQAAFMEAVGSIKEYAKVNGNIVTREDVHSFFKDMALDDAKFQMISGYLMANGIKIQGEDSVDNEFLKLMESASDDNIDESGQHISKEEQEDKKVAESKGHTVDNYGMYSADDKAQLTYVQNGILAAILLNSGAADFVVTGCGTGEGAMLALNSFPGVLCGHVVDPSDAYMFMQINDGNAIALPFAKGFGWGAELNLTYIFEKLFEGEPGGGYPKERVVPEQRNKKILDGVRAVTLKQDLVEVLKELDQDLVKGAVAGEKFEELFFANCKDEKIAEYVKTLR